MSTSMNSPPKVLRNSKTKSPRKQSFRKNPAVRPDTVGRMYSSLLDSNMELRNTQRLKYPPSVFDTLPVTAAVMFSTAMICDGATRNIPVEQFFPEEQQDRANSSDEKAVDYDIFHGYFYGGRLYVTITEVCGAGFALTFYDNSLSVLWSSFVPSTQPLRQLLRKWKIHYVESGFFREQLSRWILQCTTISIENCELESNKEESNSKPTMNNRDPVNSTATPSDSASITAATATVTDDTPTAAGAGNSLVASVGEEAGTESVVAASATATSADTTAAVGAPTESEEGSTDTTPLAALTSDSDTGKAAETDAVPESPYMGDQTSLGAFHDSHAGLRTVIRGVSFDSNTFRAHYMEKAVPLSRRAAVLIQCLVRRRQATARVVRVRDVAQKIQLARERAHERVGVRMRRERHAASEDDFNMSCSIAGGSTVGSGGRSRRAGPGGVRAEPSEFSASFASSLGSSLEDGSADDSSFASDEQMPMIQSRRPFEHDTGAPPSSGPGPTPVDPAPSPGRTGKPKSNLRASNAPPAPSEAIISRFVDETEVKRTDYGSNYAYNPNNFYKANRLSKAGDSAKSTPASPVMS